MRTGWGVQLSLVPRRECEPAEPGDSAASGCAEAEAAAVVPTQEEMNGQILAVAQ